MTLIVLTVLAAAWLGYFGLWLRDRRASRLRRDGVVGTSQYFDRSMEAERMGARVGPVSAAKASGNGAAATRPAVTHLRLSCDALDRERAPFPSVGEGVRHLADLLEPPRTRQQALRRRRLVARLIIAAALASLLAVPVFGSSALTVHVMADVGLILFAFGAVHRRQVPDVSLADVRVLYPDRPAPGDAVAMPLRRVANG